MLTGFSHVMMYVKDLERATAWYVEKLGFELVFKVPAHYASLRHPQLHCRIDLHPTEAEGQDVGFGPIPNFNTANIDDTIAQLRAKGVKSQDPSARAPALASPPSGIPKVMPWASSNPPRDPPKSLSHLRIRTTVHICAHRYDIPECRSQKF